MYHLQKDEVYLNLMLEFIPETVYKVARQYAKSKQTIPINFIRVSTFEGSNHQPTKIQIATSFAVLIRNFLSPL